MPKVDGPESSPDQDCPAPHFLNRLPLSSASLQGTAPCGPACRVVWGTGPGFLNNGLKRPFRSSQSLSIPPAGWISDGLFSPWATSFSARSE